MGRPKRRRLINIQNLNGGSDMSSSKRWKTTGNSDLEASMMRKFSNRSLRFMDAYGRGLNGRQAAWASRKYRGHRVLPNDIMEELGKKGIV